MVGLGKEVIRVMISIVNLLDAGPLSLIAAGRWKASAHFWPPLIFVAGVKIAGIKRAQRITADALLILQDEAYLWLESQIGADIDPAQRVGVFTIIRLTICAVVARFEADV